MGNFHQDADMANGATADCRSKPSLWRRRALVGLLWIALTAAAVGTAIWRWGDRAGEGILICGFFLWPTLLVLVTWSWPGITRRRRILVCCFGGVAVLASFWACAWATDDLALAYMATVMALFIAWIPQVAIICFAYLAWVFSRWLLDSL
jgi:hypothetical protein